MNNLKTRTIIILLVAFLLFLLLVGLLLYFLTNTIIAVIGVVGGIAVATIELIAIDMN